MLKNRFYVLGFVLGFLVMGGGVSGATTIYVNGSNAGNESGSTWAAGWSTIQEGIDNATAGATINVSAGTYTENVDVNKSVNLVGAGAGVTIVSASNPNDHVFHVTVNSVNISGFTATGSSNNTDGISLNGANYCNITDNVASGNYYGISLRSYSNNNTITGNNASSNVADGINIVSSINNLITENVVMNNSAVGIASNNASYNTITDNIANFNGVGIGLGPYPSGGYYGPSTYNIITNNSVNSNNKGISLADNSNYTTVTDNTVSSNNKGIYLNSSGNTIYNNRFSNSVNSYFGGTAYANSWNITKTSGTNIVGGSYLGGNFWAEPGGTGFSQTCADEDSDGICDPYYNLASGNIDYLPLASDTDSDGVVDGSDECPDTPSGTTVDASGCPAEFFEFEDEDGDGMGDKWESEQYCLDPTNGTEKDLDYDNDNFTNVEEFYAFSDPCDAGSVPTCNVAPPPAFNFSWSDKTNTNITFNEGNVSVRVWNKTDNLEVNGTLNNARLCNDSIGAPDFFDYHFRAEIVNASNQSQKIGGIGGRIVNLTSISRPISEGNYTNVSSPRGGGAKLVFTLYGSMIGAEPSFSGNITVNVSNIPPKGSCTKNFSITGGNLTGYTNVMKSFGFDFVEKGFVFGGEIVFDDGLNLSEMETKFGENITFGDGITFHGFPIMPPYAMIPNGSTIGNMSYFGKITGGDRGFFDGDFLGDGAVFDPYVKMYEGSRVEGNVTVGQNTTIGNFTEVGNFTTIGPFVDFDPFVKVGMWATILGGAKIRMNATVGKYVEIGNNSIVGRFVNISQNATLGKSVRLYDDANVGESVVIENFAEIYNSSILGANVLVGQYVKIYRGAKIWDGSIVGNKSTVGQDSEIYDGKLYSYVDVGPNVTLNKTTAENSTINYTINAANFSDDDVLINRTIINASGYISNKPGANGSIHLTEENVRVNFTNLNELRNLSSDITIHDLIRDANTGVFNVTIVGGKMNITMDGETSTDLDANAGFLTVFNDTDMGIDVGMNFTDDSDANMGVAAITINPGGVALPGKATDTNYTHVYAPGANGSNMNARLCMKLPSDIDTDTARIHYFNDTNGTWTEYPTDIEDGRACANTTHFSVYGVAGSIITYQTTTTTGAGGGGPTPAPTTVIATATVQDGKAVATLTSISKGGLGKIYIPPTAGVPFTEIVIKVLNKVTNVQLTIYKLAEKPADIAEDLAGLMHSYIQIDESNIRATDVGSVEISFKVPVSWISDNNIDKATVVLNRYADGKWTALATTKTREDFDYVYYSAASPGLSVFGISGHVRAVTTTTTTVTTTTVVTTTTAPPVSLTTKLEEEARSPVGKIIIVILAIAIIAGAAYYFYQKKKCDEECKVEVPEEGLEATEDPVVEGPEEAPVEKSKE